MIRTNTADGVLLNAVAATAGRFAGTASQNLSEIRASTAEKAGYYLDCALTSRSVDSQVCQFLKFGYQAPPLSPHCRAGTRISSSQSTSTSTRWAWERPAAAVWRTVRFSVAALVSISSTSDVASGRGHSEEASPRPDLETSSSQSLMASATSRSRRAE